MRLHRLLACAALAIAAACSAGLTQPDRLMSPDRTVARGSDPLPAPSTGALLGAWVNPSDTPNPWPTTEISETAAFESEMTSVTGMSRSLALHMHYYDWDSSTGTDPLSGVASDPSIQDDFAKGRIPVLSWRCGASLTDIASGANGTGKVISQAAAAVASLNHPVFLRFFWEFNIDFQGQGANGDAPTCFTYDHTKTFGQNLPLLAAQFTSAWKNVHIVFHNAGAQNVSWVWCPDGSPVHAQGDQLASFFPHGYVDWIGVDAYDKQNLGFVKLFTPFYLRFGAYPSASPMPIMIGETGEPAANPAPYTQAQFFTDALGALDGGAFPNVKAFMYFDSPGGVGSTGTPWIWTLTPGTAGFNSFATIAANPFFNPPQP